MDPRIYFIVPYVLSAAAIIGTGLYTLLRRDSRGAVYLALMNFSAGWWALTEGMLYTGASAASNIWITKVQYLGIVPTAPFAFLFIIDVFGFSHRITSTLKYLLILFGGTTLLFAFGYPWIKLLWTDHYVVTHGLFPMLGWRYGWYFWVFTGLNHCLLLIATIILIRALGFSDPILKKRAKVFLGGFSVVWIINMVYVAGLSPLRTMDMSPLCFSVTAGAMVYGYYRFNMLDLFPAAQKAAYSRMNDVLLVLDPKDRVVEINPAATALLKVDETWVVGRSMDDVLRDWPAFADRLKKGQGGMIDSADGTPKRTYDLRLTPLKDRRGRHLGRLATLRDTSILTPMDNRHHLMALIDRDRVLTDANDSFLAFHQRDSGMFGQLITSFPNILNNKENMGYIGEAFASNRTLTGPFEYSGRAYETRLFPFEEENGREARVLCIIKDVTEEKINEKRIMQANKMSAIGRLAAGMAHEIRNPLGLIRNHCYLLKKEFQNRDTLPVHSIQAMENAVNRAMGVIEHLLTFSRTSPVNDQHCNVLKIIERIVAISADTAAKAGVTVSFDCPDRDVAGVGEDTLNIILANLLANALDAMKAGGTCHLAAMVDSGYLKMEISDTGIGIDKHHIDCLFEPFFTVNKGDKGIGLGLYIVYNEVQKYGGSISVRSEPGRGSTFTVIIPTLA